MPKRLEISVALASCNGARFIFEQLASIQAQSLSPAEIIVSDDASDDETLCIVERFAAGSPIPVRIHRQTTRLGIFLNFATALQMCNGTHIAYCDQDDVWETDKLRRMATSLGQDGVVLALHQSLICDSQLRPIGGGMVIPDLTGGRYAWPGPSGPVWGHAHQMVFRRELWELTRQLLSCQVQPKPELTTNFDALLLCTAGILGDVYVAAAVLTYFRRHAGSASEAGKFRRGKLISRLASQRQLTEWHYRNATQWRRFLDDPRCRAIIDAHAVSPRGRPPRSTSYLKALDQRIAATGARLNVYTASTVWRRMSAICNMIARGALGDVYAGKLRWRLLLVDMLAIVMQPRIRGAGHASGGSGR